MRYLRDNQLILAKDRTYETGIMAYHHRLSTRGKFLGDFSYTRWANEAADRFEQGKPIGEWKDETLSGWCEKYTHLMYTGEIRSNRGTPYTENSIKTYANACQVLFRFGRRMGLKATRAEYREYFSVMEKYMEKEGYNPKTRAEVINAIHIMVYHWTYEFNLPQPERHRMQKVEKPIVVIPPELISVIVNDDRFIGTDLQHVWEAASTILLTTLRLSDILGLKPEHFTDESGRMAIVKETQKTGSMVAIPIPDRLASIFRKNLAKGSPWSAPIDAATLHAKLRSIFSPFPEVNKPHTIGGQTKLMWEWVTPHMLRKSAITGLIYYGVDHLSVRHASGHSQNSAAFWKYVMVVDSRFRSEISAGHEAMLKSHNPTSTPAL